MTDIDIEIERLKQLQLEALGTDDLHAVQRIHNRLQKLIKAKERENDTEK